MRNSVGLCAIFSNVDEFLSREPAEKVNRRQQSQRINDKYFYNI